MKLSDSKLKPELYVQAVPKLTAIAYLYAKLKMPDDAPTLPGRVALFRDGSYVGAGYLPALAPASEHELGFGEDTAVTVKYAVLREKRGESGLITSSKTEQRNFKISLQNQHKAADQHRGH